MKLKKLLKVLRPYQYIKVSRIENGSSLTDVIYARDFPLNDENLNCKVQALITKYGRVDSGSLAYMGDYLEIYIEI